MLQLVFAVALFQDYFPLEEGHSWVYESTAGEKKKEVVKTVSGKEKVGDADCFVVEDRGMGGDFRKLFLQKTKDGVQVRRMRAEITEPFAWLKFPFEKGVRWVTTLSSPEKNDKADLEFVIEDEEEVVVPAGTYKARKVRMHGSEKGGDKRIELSMWYAADVGEVKRVIKLVRGADKVDETTLLLVKFNKGK